MKRTRALGLVWVALTQVAADIHPSATVDPSATLGAGASVGAGAFIGPEVAVGDASIAARATLVGRDTGPLAQPVGDGSAIGRRAFIGADAHIGADVALARAVQVGSGFTAGDGATVGYAAVLGDDVTLGPGAGIGNLASVGDGTTVDGFVGRGATVGANAILTGQVGPDATLGDGARVHGKVRRSGVVEFEATVELGATVGRGATIGAGAQVEAGASVRAGATVPSCAIVGTEAIVGRGQTFAGPDRVTPCAADLDPLLRAGVPLSSGNVELYDVDVDPQGNMYVAGVFGADATLGGAALDFAGGYDILVASFDRDGDLRWARQFNNPGDDRANAIDWHGGALYVSGYFGTELELDGTTLTKTPGWTGNDGFVARMDPANGSIVWARQAGSDGLNPEDLVATDDGAYVTGQWRNNAAFGSVTLSGSASGDAYVAHIDPDGVWQWAKIAAAGGNDTGFALAADPDGFVYAAINFRGNLSTAPGVIATGNGTSGTILSTVVTRLDPTGAPQCQQLFKATGHLSAGALAADAAGVVLAASYTGSVTAPTLSMNAGTQTRALIAAMDSSCAVTGAWTTAGAGSSLPSGVKRDGAQIFVHGRYQNGAVGFGSTTLTSTPIGTWVGAIDAAASWQWVVGSTGPLATGTNAFPYALGLNAQAVYAVGYARPGAVFGSHAMPAGSYNNGGYLLRILRDGTW